MKDLVRTLKLDEKGRLALEKKSSNRGFKQDYDSEIEKKNMFSHVPLPNKNREKNGKYKENKMLPDFTDESYNDEKDNGQNENSKLKDRYGQKDPHNQGLNVINEKAQHQQSEVNSNNRQGRLINYDSETNNKELETDLKERTNDFSKPQNEQIQNIDDIKKTFDKLDENDKNLLRKFIIHETLSPTKESKEFNSGSLLGEFQVKPSMQEKISPRSNKQEEVIGLQKKYLNAPAKIEVNSLNKSDIFEDTKNNKNNNENDIDVEEYENDFELSESAIGDVKKLGESGFTYKTPYGNDKEDSKVFNSKYLENLNNYISSTKPNSLDVDLSKFK